MGHMRFQSVKRFGDLPPAKEMTLTEDMIAQIKDSEVVAMGSEIGLHYITHQSRTRQRSPGTVGERTARRCDRTNFTPFD